MTRTIQFNVLRITITETANAVIYEFSGDVDEHFRHSEVPKIKKPHIIFELSHIRNFNSVGIREWIYLIRDFDGVGRLTFKNCSVSMIDQINMVPDSLGNAQIESFYAPYFCDSDSCQKEVNHLIEVTRWQQFLNNKVAPQFRCETCNEPLQFDALEESYFLFANSSVKKVS